MWYLIDYALLLFEVLAFQLTPLPLYLLYLFLQVKVILLNELNILETYVILLLVQIIVSLHLFLGFVLERLLIACNFLVYTSRWLLEDFLLDHFII